MSKVYRFGFVIGFGWLARCSPEGGAELLDEHGGDVGLARARAEEHDGVRLERLAQKLIL